MPERVFRNLAYLNGLSITGTNTRVKDVMFYLPVKMDDGDVKMFTGLNTITLEVLTKVVWPTVDLNEAENLAFWKCAVVELFKHNSFRNSENFLKNQGMMQKYDG